MRTALLALVALLTLPAQAQVDLELDWARMGDRTGQLGIENGTASVESAEFSPDGSLIVSGAKRGGDLILWRVSDGQEIWRRYHDNRAEIEVVTFTRDGTHLVSGGEDGFLRAWRVSDGEEVWDYSTNPNAGSDVSFDGLGLSNDGTRLAGGDEQGRLVVFDTSDPNPANWSDEPIAVVFQGPDNNATSDADINSVDWTQDDRFIVTAGRDGTVKRWEAANLNDADQGLREVYEGFQSSIKSVRLSPDDQLIAAGGQRSPDGLVLVWNYASAQIVHREDFPLTKKIEAVEWTPNGRFLITGGNEGRTDDASIKPAYPDNGGFGPIRAFDREDGFALVDGWETFRQEYFDFNAAGDRLVVSSEDGGVRLWDVTYESAPGQAPFGNAPAAVPGRIEAERYDQGGAGVAYNDADGQNQGGAFRPGEGVDVQTTTDAGGGFNVGWIETGEWLEYTVDVAQAGLYDLDFRVASQSNGGALRVEGGGDVARVSFLATGGWQSWTTVTASDVALEAGRQVLRVTAEDRLFNLNYIDVVAQDAPFPAAGASYTLENVATGGVLDVGSGGDVTVTPASGAQGQRWRFLEAGGSAFWIDNARGDRGALDTRDAGGLRWTSAATPEGDDKLWTVEPVGDGSYRIRNVRVGRDFLAAVGGGTAGWTSATGPETRWVPTADAAAVAAPTATPAGLEAAPTEVTLAAPYPNPSQGRPTVVFGLPDAGVATLEVFDALGRRVATVADGGTAAGWHRVEVGQALPAGAYLVRLRVEAGGAVAVETQSLVVVR